MLAQIDPPSQNVLFIVITTLWGSLVGVVVAMWKFIGKRLNACEKDRKELWEVLTRNGIKKSESD
jgi:hypothetical protein